MQSVDAGTPLSDLFAPVSRSTVGLAVVDHEQRLLGAVTGQSLLTVLGEQEQMSATDTADEFGVASLPENGSREVATSEV